jgi:flagellar hook assembly protein FlgD
VYKYSSESVSAPVVALTVIPRRGKVFDDLESLEAVGQTNMPITVPADASRLTVRIWDRFGDHVRTLVDEANPSGGGRTLVWDRTDDAGQLRPPGYVICRVTVDETSESRLARIKET